VVTVVGMGEIADRLADAAAKKNVTVERDLSEPELRLRRDECLLIVTRPDGASRPFAGTEDRLKGVISRLPPKPARQEDVARAEELARRGPSQRSPARAKRGGGRSYKR
jgi:hypothetical protein